MTRLYFVLLVAVALCFGCADGPESDPVYELASGVYDFTLDADEPFSPHTCWDPGFPPASLPLQFELEVEKSGALVFRGSGVSDELIPPLSGVVAGNAFSTGAESFELDGRETEELDPDYTGNPGEGNCTLVFEAFAEGTLTGDNQFDGHVPITISDLNGNGCEELYGDTLSGSLPIPFPAVESGPCILGIQGAGVLPKT